MAIVYNDKTALNSFNSIVMFTNLFKHSLTEFLCCIFCVAKKFSRLD